MDNVLDTIIAYFEEKELKDWVGSVWSREEKISEIKIFLSTWLKDNSSKIKGMSLSTHPCLFVHPSSARNQVLVTIKNKVKNMEILTSAIVAESKSAMDGYVRTGNVDNIRKDTYGNAALMRIYKFLQITMPDGKNLFEHIENDTSIARDILSLAKGISYDETRANFLSLKKDSNAKPCSSSKLKQVYFPIGKDDYHVLSILMPSGIMDKVNNIIRNDKFSDRTKALKEKRTKNEYCEETIKDYADLTVVGFGGTKPQNISILNNENNGKFYFLPSKPPTVERNRIKLPRSDFFKNILWSGKYRSEYKHFHRLLLAEPNNINIREGRDRLILDIFDDIVENIFVIRSVGPGWSEREQYLNLPEYQKILLDDLYSDRRGEDETFKSFLMGVARFIQKSYKNVLKDAAISMADDELLYCYKLIEKQAEILR